MLKIPNDSKRFDVGIFILFSSCGQTAHRKTLVSDVFGCQNVPRRYFCCGSLLLLVLAVRIYTLVQLLC